MILTGILITILLLAIAYFIIWPLYKNRPVLLIISSMWLLYGITDEQIKEAMQKAASMGRADFKQDSSFYILTDYFKISIVSLGGKLYFISYSSLSSSNKTKLLKKLFKKMLLNYFIAQPTAQ